eukprot:8950421-Pyramimonas_sp.AAC.1
MARRQLRARAPLRGVRGVGRPPLQRRLGAFADRAARAAPGAPKVDPRRPMGRGMAVHGRPGASGPCDGPRPRERASLKL